MATVTKPDSDVNRKNSKSILTDEWFHFDKEGEFFHEKLHLTTRDEVDRWFWAG